MGKKATKTEIVLSHANLEALLSAFEALKACFGEDLAFRESIVRQSDKKSLNYEIEVWGIIPAKTLGGDESAVLHSFVSFALRNVVGYNAYVQTDPVEIKVIGGEMILKLQKNRAGEYMVFAESELSIERLKKAMCIYYLRT